ncbi:MAG: hypothetical protein HY686_03890 [Chloroflexi bacterium]|nr:hypothetical protein [Chloroflexota bacterium]
MVAIRPGASEAEIARKLCEGAVDVWGPLRAEELRPNLERLAASLWQLSQNLPKREEEPAFFL